MEKIIKRSLSFINMIKLKLFGEIKDAVLLYGYARLTLDWVKLCVILHSRAVGIIINTNFLVGNFLVVQFMTRQLVFTIILITHECSIMPS